MNIIQKPTNKHSSRNGKPIQYIIIHWIVGTLASCDHEVLETNREMSTHYAIGKNKIHQYVQEDRAAWTVGIFDINQRSINIEHEGGPNLPISEETYYTSAQLIKDICTRYNLPINKNVIKGHREFKATECPGTFDIDRVIRMANEIGGDVRGKLVQFDGESAVYEHIVNPEEAEKRFGKDWVSQIEHRSDLIDKQNKINELNTIALQLKKESEVIVELQKNLNALAQEKERLIKEDAEEDAYFTVERDNLKKQYTQELIASQTKINDLTTQLATLESPVVKEKTLFELIVAVIDKILGKKE